MIYCCKIFATKLFCKQATEWQLLSDYGRKIHNLRQIA